jgi:AraC-like DNA-binding protein
MKQYSIDIPNDPKKSILESLETFEKQLNLSLTLHDHLGILKDTQGVPILPNRFFHQHLICFKGRYQYEKWNKNCFNDCAYKSEDKIKKDQKAFIKTCWKGVVEVVVPIFEGGQLALTIYAGAFRSEDLKRATIPKLKWYQEMLKKLPLASEPLLHSLAQTIELWGIGLVSRLRTQSPHLPKAGRGHLIKEAFQKLSGKATSLKDFADYLQLSPSRARHLAKELTGKSFSELLTEERLLRAKYFILSTDFKINEIADKCGYKNPYHFNRVFKLAVGLPPAKFRKQGKNPIFAKP